MLLENYSSAKVTQITTEIHLFANWPLFYPGERVDSDSPPPRGVFNYLSDAKILATTGCHYTQNEVQKTNLS